MSEFKIPVLEHDSEPHPNADSLELAKIGGWRCVTHILRWPLLLVTTAEERCSAENLYCCLGISVDYHQLVYRLVLSGSSFFSSPNRRL